MAPPDTQATPSLPARTSARWGVVVLAFAGLLSCAALGFIVFFVIALLGLGHALLGLWPIAFTLVTLVPAVALWRSGNGGRRGFAVGLAIGWVSAAVILGWQMASWYVSTHGPAQLTAFDSSTGQRIWTAEFDGANGVSTPVISDGLVFVQTGRSREATAGAMAALDAETGRKLWEVRIDASPADCAGVLEGRPVVGTGVAVVRGPDGSIRGLDARTGRVRWQARLAGAPAAVAGDTVLIGANTTYTALDLMTGEQRWTRTIPDAATRDSAPGEHAFALGAGSVFMVELTDPDPMQTTFNIAAMDAGTGRDLWRAPSGSLDSTVQRYIVDGTDTLVTLESPPYVGPDFPELLVAAREVRSGKLLWTKPRLPRAPSGLPRTGIAAHSGSAFYASSAGRLVALSSRSAAHRWTKSFPHEDPEFPPQLIAGENLVVVRHVNRLSVFDVGDGTQRWSAHLDSGSDLEATPAVTESTVIVPWSSDPCMPPTVVGLDTPGRQPV
jgi:outer membrane protein assembly factor BamB